MSKFEKLKQKFLTKSKNFTYDELKALLNGFGYKEFKIGKTSGSRVAFIDEETQHVIRLHKPHPKNILKRYQLDLVEEELRSVEVIK
jgi:HicA toxin of bacterial toxin-antitoxin,